MKTKFMYVFLAALMILSLALTACQPEAAATPEPAAEEPAAAAEEAAEEPAAEEAAAEEPAVEEAAPASDPDTIIIGTTDKIASLDSGDAYATRDWELIKNVNDGLLNWKPGTTEIEPDLATDLGTVSEDGLTYTFTLKEGIVLADGTPVTATMYAAQLNRLLTIGPSCPNDVADALAIPYIASIEAPDDMTMVFTLHQPIAYFRNLLATAPFVMSDPKLFPEDECVLYPEAPIYGTGAWFISQYNPDEQLVLEPNPYYTGAYPAQVKQIIIRQYSDPNTMSLAVQSGEIDIAWRFLSPDQITSLQDIEDLSIGTIAGGSIRFLVMNLTMAPTDDPNVVKAIASIIDRDEISDTVFGGQVEPLYSMIPPGFLGANEAWDDMYASPDLDAAVAYLADSGYTADNPLELTLMYPPEHYGASTAAWMEIIQKQIESTGVVNVTLKDQEWSTYVPALTGGQAFNVGVLGWFFDYPDPSNYLDPFVYNGGMGNNITAPSDDNPNGVGINDTASELTDLLVKADVELDDDARIELYRQAQELYADLSGNIPLFFSAEHIIYRPNISGTAEQATPETLNIGGNVLFYYSMLQKK